MSQRPDAEALLDGLGQGIWSAWCDTLALCYVNPAAEKVFGYPSSELLERPALWLDFIHDEDRLAFGAAMGSVRQGHSAEVECRFVREDGGVRWVQLCMRPAGLRMDGVALDVTSRRRVEDDLRERNEMLYAIIQSSPLAIVTLDFDGNVRSWNPAAEKTFGWTEEEVLGRPNPIVPALKKEEFRAYFDRVIEGGALRRVEVRRQRKDGLSVDISVTTAPLHNARGEVRGMIGVMADVTERTRAASQKEAVGVISGLFLTHDSLEEVYQALPAILAARLEFPIVAVALLDEAGDELVVMGSAGLDDSLLGGRVPVDGSLSGLVVRSGQMMVEADVSHHAEYASSNLSLSAVKTFLCAPMKMGDRLIGTLTLADRRKRDIDATLSDTVQVIASYLAQAIERKQGESEILTLNATLERRVLERTAELQEAIHDLESFSYSVSHDLRSPLRAIDGFSRILQEDYGDKLDADGQKVVGVILNNVGKMGRLIDDLLAFARLGRKAMEGTAIDMRALVASIFEELMQMHPERLVALDLGSLPSAWGDASMIRQVLVNLLSNAIKFTRDQLHARIEVSGHVEGREATFCVRDNGAGFDMQYAARLFGVFQRLHKATEYDGTGVGLAIVARIVQRHGGRVSAEAEVGKGAIFTLTLPTEESNRWHDVLQS